MKMNGTQMVCDSLVAEEAETIFGIIGYGSQGHAYTLKRQNEEHLIEEVGEELRRMMPWLKG